MNKLPLLKVRYAAAYAQALDSAGVSSSHIFAKAKVSERILEDNENWMLVKQLGDFVEAAVYKSGHWGIGLEASIIPRVRQSSFSRKYFFAPTLYQSLCSICDNSSMEDTSANFQLIPRGDTIWLDCGTIRGSQESIRQIELYRYGALLNVIRLASGKDWLPPLLHLQSA